jgi:hypothetical protein
MVTFIICVTHFENSEAKILVDKGMSTSISKSQNKKITFQLIDF